MIDHGTSTTQPINADLQDDSVYRNSMATSPSNESHQKIKVLMKKQQNYFNDRKYKTQGMFNPANIVQRRGSSSSSRYNIHNNSLYSNEGQNSDYLNNAFGVRSAASR